MIWSANEFTLRWECRHVESFLIRCLNTQSSHDSEFPQNKQTKTNFNSNVETLSSSGMRHAVDYCYELHLLKQKIHDMHLVADRGLG